MPQSHRKDPDAVLDYSIDWSDWLTGSEVITVSTWTVPSGITKDSDSNDDTQTVIWLSGGTAGNTYKIVNHIETDSSPVRKDDRSISVYIVER
jgi:hypothetical protein